VVPYDPPLSGPISLPLDTAAGVLRNPRAIAAAGPSGLTKSPFCKARQTARYPALRGRPTTWVPWTATDVPQQGGTGLSPGPSLDRARSIPPRPGRPRADTFR